jgi:hypothetical protein
MKVILLCFVITVASYIRLPRSSVSQDLISHFRSQSNFYADGYIIFAEHRYYGESLPFGEYSFTPQNISYLSAEQGLADYATMVADFKYDKIAKFSYFIN